MVSAFGYSAKHKHLNIFLKIRSKIHCKEFFCSGFYDHLHCMVLRPSTDGKCLVMCSGFYAIFGYYREAIKCFRVLQGCSRYLFECLKARP